MSEETLLPSEPQESASPDVADGDNSGSAEQPQELILGKFKTHEDVVKSYSELEKHLGGFTGAPESYALPDGLDGEDTIVQKLSEMGLKSNMSQAMFNELLEFGDEVLGVNQQINREKELEALGENAEQRLNNVNGFLKNNLGDKYEELAEIVNTAKAVELVESLIKATKPAAIPTTPTAPVNVPTQGEIERMMTETDEQGKVIYHYSKTRQREVQEAFSRMHGAH